MPTVDLPAHNVVINEAAPTSYAEIVGGSEALATTSEDSYVRFDWNEGLIRVRVGYEWDPILGFVDALGFGLWDPASVGATAADVTDVRFVAEGYTDGFGAQPDSEAVDEATYFAWNGADHTNTPIVRYPLVTIGYDGDPWTGAGDQGYNISTFPDAATGPAECAVQLQHLIGGDDYVIAGIGTPDTGTDGLRPQLNLPEYPAAVDGGASLYLTYLAIRITYGAARRRIRGYPVRRSGYPGDKNRVGYPRRP